MGQQQKIKVVCTLENPNDTWQCAARIVKYSHYIDSQYKQFGTPNYTSLRNNIRKYLVDKRLRLVQGNNTVYIPVYVFGNSLKNNHVYRGHRPRRAVAPVQRRRSTVRISVGSNKLLWLARVKELHGHNQAKIFERNVRKYCSQRNINPNHLMALMALESARSFNPKEPNMKSYKREGKWKDTDITNDYLDALMKTENGWPKEIIPKGIYKDEYPYAFGLIQFKATAAKEIGTTLKRIYNSGLNEQFEYVKRYLDKKGVQNSSSRSDFH